MKKIAFVFACLLIITVVFSGCQLTEKFSKKSDKEVVSASILCTNCQAAIDVTGLEKGCEVKCPACNTACTY